MYLGHIEGVEFDASALVVHGGWGTTFDTIELTAGRHADPTSPHEVVLPAATADEAGVGVGDTITLHTLSPAQARQYIGIEDADPAAPAAPGPVIELEVVGIGGTLTNLIETEESFIYATPAFGDRYMTTVGHFGVGGIGGGFAAVRLHDGQADLTAFDADMRAALDVDDASEDFSVQARSATIQDVEAAISTTSTGALVFAIVAGIATVFAVGQAVGRHLVRSQPEQTALSALGLPRRTRAAALALGVVPVAAGAAVLAVAVATVASAFTPFGAARRFEPDSGVQPDVVVAGVGALTVVAVVTLLGGVQGWRATRPASERSRGKPTIAGDIRRTGGGNANRDDWCAPRLRTRPRSPDNPVPIGVGVGRDRNRRDRRRAVVCGEPPQNRDRPGRWGWAWDVVVDVDSQRLDEAIGALTELDEVSGVATVTDRQVVVEGHVTRGQSFDVHQGRVPAVVHAGRVPGAPGEIALGTAVSRRLDRDVGDKVTVTTRGRAAPS